MFKEKEGKDGKRIRNGSVGYLGLMSSNVPERGCHVTDKLASGKPWLLSYG